ncbi:MAG: nucleotide exchange factor GrpE [Candidatus Eisenbacteria bacterium]|nr:nucleotide exchange factor GrpE [Candidatus Eisenbacteria bacterium]
MGKSSKEKQEREGPLNKPEVPPEEIERPASIEPVEGTASETESGVGAGSGAAEIEELQARVVELTDKWLRAAADLDNYRKRAARERERDLWLARSGVTLPFLDVLDDFDRALAGDQTDPEAFRRGMELIRQKFLAALSGVGVEPFVSIGRPFDPERHEALHRIASAEVPEGHVAAEIRRGYRSGERILRPALVAVAVSEGTKEPSDVEE